MNKDIHDDHLDDYVRKSFDDYEEDPQDNMWNRIEQALEEPEQTRRPLFFWANRWSIAASFVIFSLLAGLAYSHFYYEGKIQELSNTHSNKQILPQTPAVITIDPVGVPLIPLSQAQPPVVIIENAPTNTTLPKAPIIAKNVKKDSFEPEVVPKSSLHTNSTTVVNSSAPIIPASILPVLEKETTPVEQQTGAGLVHLQAEKTMDALEQLPVSALTIFPINTPKATLSSVIIPVIEPHKTTSGWYVGVQTTQFSLRERGGSADSSDNNGIGHHLVNRQQKVTSRSEVGLEVGKKLSRNFGVESGVSYRSFTRLAAHSPRFRFRDGILHTHNPGSNRDFDFSYNLDTYSGETAVTVRMEEVDNTTPALPDEPLNLRIITSEHTEAVRIPLLFSAQHQFGRLSLVAKTGLVGTIITGSQLDITSRLVGPGRFQPAAGTGAYSLKLLNANRFFLGYQCNAGLEVKLGQHLAGSMDMGISGDFDRKQKGNQNLPGLFTSGITAGLSYYF